MENKPCDTKYCVKVFYIHVRIETRFPCHILQLLPEQKPCILSKLNFFFSKTIVDHLNLSIAEMQLSSFSKNIATQKGYLCLKNDITVYMLFDSF